MNVLNTFPLSSQAGRVALLTGILDGSVKKPEIINAVEVDIQPRKKVPVVVEGRRFASIANAARWLDFLENPYTTGRHRNIKNIEGRIRRLCNADNTKGYYWAV